MVLLKHVLLPYTPPHHRSKEVGPMHHDTPPNHRLKKVGSIHHDTLPHHRPKDMEPTNHELKPQNCEPKENFSFYELIISRIYLLQ
jgi:hypothetical protein